MEWIIGILLFFVLFYASGYAFYYGNRENLAILLFIAAVISVPFMGYMFEIGQGGDVMIEVKDQKVVSFARNIIVGWNSQGYNYPGTRTRQHEFDYCVGQGEAFYALHFTLFFRIGQTLEQHQQYYDNFLRNGSKTEESVVGRLNINNGDVIEKVKDFVPCSGYTDEQAILEDAIRNAYRRIFKNTGLEALAVSLEIRPLLKKLPEAVGAVVPEPKSADAEKSQSEEKK